MNLLRNGTVASLLPMRFARTLHARVVSTDKPSPTAAQRSLDTIAVVSGATQLARRTVAGLDQRMAKGCGTTTIPRRDHRASTLAESD